MAKKAKAVANLAELRYKMAEKFAELENDEISVGQAKAFVGIAGVIVNSLKVEIVNNQNQGISKSIDWLEQPKQLQQAESGGIISNNGDSYE